MSSNVLLRLVVLTSLASLAACTLTPGPEVASPDTVPAETAPADMSIPAEPAPPLAPSANPAVVALLDAAHADANAGRLPTAAAAVERALRIEPRNPLLWQELARLKLQQGDYKLAENFAARSNSWAGSNKALQAQNWRLISEARSLRGDNVGAKAALARAKALELMSAPE